MLHFHNLVATRMYKTILLRQYQSSTCCVNRKGYTSKSTSLTESHHYDVTCQILLRKEVVRAKRFRGVQRKEFEEIYSDVNLLAEVSLASTRILSSCRSRLIVRRAVIEAVLHDPLEGLPVDS